MEELERILRLHAGRYPNMEPTDAVKLIYQNEFGGGHLIRDEVQAMEYLRREYAGVKHEPAAERTEPIGNGILRVNLAALEPREVEALGEAFLRSAAERRGSMTRFLEKLERLSALTREGIFSFGSRELEDYLERYRQAGCPAVSHSPSYRAHYHPAYRIIAESSKGSF